MRTGGSGSPRRCRARATAASGGFAVYTASFGSYNKTWGSLSAVIEQTAIQIPLQERRFEQRRQICLHYRSRSGGRR